MVESPRELLEAFDRLTEAERAAFTLAFLRRIGTQDVLPLADEELAMAADEFSSNSTSGRRRMPAPIRGEVWLVDLGSHPKSTCCCIRDDCISTAERKQLPL